MRVALVERHLLGGTCVNTGCFPTKTLVASARAMHLARRGEEFGFETGPVRDFTMLLASDLQAVESTIDGTEVRVWTTQDAPALDAAGWIDEASPSWTISVSAARSWGMNALLQVTLPSSGTDSVRMYSRTQAWSGTIVPSGPLV